MIDGQRAYPVNYFFLHHSVGPDFVNAEDIEVQDWYSETGRWRAYSGGIENGGIDSLHEHPSRPGKRTYAQAQFTLREYTKDGNKYGWRLTDLIKNPWANVAWAVGNWAYNQKSCSVEVCGNYLNKILPDKALMCMADFLREIDQELIKGGYPGGINVWLHQEVYATACPARIKEQRNKLVDMINNPDKWNNILWPPQPVVTTKEETKVEELPFNKETIEDPSLPKGETKITQAGVNGTKTTIYLVTYTDGKETSRTIKSEAVKAPVSEITAIGTYEKPLEPETPDTGDLKPSEDENAANWLVRLFKWIMDILSKFKIGG